MRIGSTNTREGQQACSSEIDSRFSTYPSKSILRVFYALFDVPALSLLSSHSASAETNRSSFHIHHSRGKDSRPVVDKTNDECRTDPRTAEALPRALPDHDSQ
jgi:hypothetical protein